MSKAIIDKNNLPGDVTEYLNRDAFPNRGPALNQGLTHFVIDLETKNLYIVTSAQHFPPQIENYSYTQIGCVGDVLLTIPDKYVELYERILHLLIEYGEEALKDCKTTCKDRNINIIDCYNMFLSLLAANELGKETLADVLYEHITYKLDYYFNSK